jgi:preprotein translocase subunit Sec61beta
MFEFIVIYLGFGVLLAAGLIVYPNFNQIRNWGREQWEGTQSPKKVVRQGRQQVVQDENGQPVMETVKKGKKTILKERRGKIATYLLLMMGGSILSIVFFQVILGPLGSSIIFAFLFSLLGSIGSRKFIGKGMIIGGVVGVINILWPAAITGTVVLAAWLTLIPGSIAFVAEELTENEMNIFPWYILYLCLFFIIWNIFQAAIDGSYGHHFYIHQILNQDIWWVRKTADIFPPVSHLYGETNRVWLIFYQLAEAFQWLVAGVLIFLLAAPGEIKNWVDQAQMGEALKNLLYSVLGFFSVRRTR